MKRFPAYILQYFVVEVTQLISNKYGFAPMAALRLFLKSETYRMLIDPELEMWEFSPLIILDLWENERITGNPRTSVFIRSE